MNRKIDDSVRKSDREIAGLLNEFDIILLENEESVRRSRECPFRPIIEAWNRIVETAKNRSPSGACRDELQLYDEYLGNLSQDYSS